MTEDWTNGGFGIYVHWPYCMAKCPYCDFNSHVSAQIDHREWEDAYIAQLRRATEHTGSRVVSSVFFGGGTPSLMEPRVVDHVINEVQRLWPCANDLEITLEANPTSVEAQKFHDFRSAGVSRISMGVQALNDADLRRLGRLHSAQEAIDAFDIARRTFDRVSFDLMYGRQNQSLKAWEQELKQALTMAIDHISLYQLTIEGGTAFGDRYKAGKLNGLPDDDLSADMFEITQEITKDEGMPAYEVSNHARDGAVSRHNMIYWRYGDYLGIGPGAHGRITMDGTRYATDELRQPNRWLGAAEKTQWTALDRSDEATEFLLMGLRLREGINTNRYEALAGKPLDAVAVANLEELGLAYVTDGHFIVSDQGIMVLNEVIRQLLA